MNKDSLRYNYEWLNTPIRSFPGVGEKRAAAYNRIGITLASDLLRHFPRAYQHRGNIKSLAEARDGEICALILTVGTQPQGSMIKKGLTVTKFSAFDDSGKCTVVFFNQNYIRDVFHIGETFRFWGKVMRRGRGAELSSPQFEPCLPGRPLPEFVPLYPLSYPLTQKLIYSSVGLALNYAAESGIPEIIPEEVREKYSLTDASTAYKMIHRPLDYTQIEKARAYFAFEELYTFSLGLALTKNRRRQGSAHIMNRVPLDGFLSALPFKLTDAQNGCISDIIRDMCADIPHNTNKAASAPAVPENITNTHDSAETQTTDIEHVSINCVVSADKYNAPVSEKNAGTAYNIRPPMSRLVSGDVGSGKTAVAAAAIYICIKNGFQAALMAPTEILAEQHYRELSPLFSFLGYDCALLTGSTPAKSKREIKQALSDGSLPFVIGTHALLTADVIFKNPGLVITDEQHRFGVMQRATLASRSGSGYDPHVLVMSATPIPRTLALILYGDLDVSTIDTLPPGRQKVDTYCVGESYRKRLNAFIRKNVEQGGQVYIVCPTVEKKSDPDEEELNVAGEIITFDFDDGAPPLKSAVQYAGELQSKIFPDLRTAFLHGKMKPAEKDKIMRSFACGEIDILVSTTVIEVGVNVPNASLMIVENAERFGLSQLHQLRGRVGRGSRKSYCILVSDAKGENAKERMKVMCATNNGFEIANKDLELRGPGDFIPSGDGTARQSGSFSLTVASLCTDVTLLQKAYEEAERTVARDPELKAPENRYAARSVSSILKIQSHSIN